MSKKLTVTEFETKMNNFELDSEYSDYIMEHCAGDRMICNGDQLILAIEDGYLYDEFKSTVCEE